MIMTIPLLVGSLLSSLLLDGGTGKRAPAWQALQPRSSTRTAHHYPPPCLDGVPFVGVGKVSGWELGTYACDALTVTVRLRPDRNPDEPCCRLVFVDDDEARVGLVHLGCGDGTASTLKGMAVDERSRGRGLSKVLVAVWLRLCADASLTPRTGVVNKPLLSLTLARFGFTPTNRRSYRCVVGGDGDHAADNVPYKIRRLVDDASSTGSGSCDGAARTVHVRTEFELRDGSDWPDRARAVATTVVRASPEAMRRALTLRVESSSSSLRPCLP